MARGLGLLQIQAQRAQRQRERAAGLSFSGAGSGRRSASDIKQVPHCFHCHLLDGWWVLLSVPWGWMRGRRCIDLFLLQFTLYVHDKGSPMCMTNATLIVKEFW
jgi:hypothetical protein